MGRTNTALEDSIKHWEEIRTEAEDALSAGSSVRLKVGGTYCALCCTYSCHACPVFKRTGVSGCRGTPYKKVCTANIGGRVTQELVDATNEMVLFLKSLRDSTETSEQKDTEVHVPIVDVQQKALTLTLENQRKTCSWCIYKHVYKDIRTTWCNIRSVLPISCTHYVCRVTEAEKSILEAVEKSCKAQGSVNNVADSSREAGYRLSNAGFPATGEMLVDIADALRKDDRYKNA